MEFLVQITDVFLHLDNYLGVFLHDYGAWIYLLLFLIVFAETGLVIMPFLPGDSLLFVAGTLAATGGMNVLWLAALLSAAAILGDTVNFWVGNYLGSKLLHGKNSRWINKKHLDYTHAFYQRHGGKTIVIARFIPILRTFAPFVAGLGRMPYSRFMVYNVFGGLVWVVSLLLAGYYFGNLPWVKQNLSLVIVGIILVSISPGIIEYLRHRRRRT